MRCTLIAVALLLASSAGAVVDVVCPDGTRYIGTGEPPCAIRCAFGGWVMPGEECSEPRRTTGAEEKQHSDGDVGTGILGVLLLVFVGVLYFAPTLAAYSRGHHQRQAILVLNLLLGWTVLGWIACAVWCSSAIRRDVET